MHRLAWYTAGFAVVCLLCCYGAPGLWGPLAAASGALLLTALVLTRLPALRRAAQGPVHAVLRRALALCLGAFCAAGWTWGWTALFRAPAEALAGQTGTFSGTVVSYPAVTSIGGRSVTVSLDDPAADVLVYAPESWDALAPGDRVVFDARLAAADRVRGEETTYFTAKGIFLLGYAREAPLSAETPDRLPVRFWPARCAKLLKDSLCAAFPADAAPLAVALTTGDKSGVPQGLSGDLSRAGASHVLVVSGMHVSSLVMLFLLLARRRKRLALIVLPLLLFYALMAGGSPSALRAVAMQAALLLAPFAKREYDPPSSLAFALLLLLLADPYAAASVSLQLSFTAAAGILIVTPPLARRWDDALRRSARRHTGKGRRALFALARFAAGELAVSLGAMTFSQPVLAYYFGSASLVFPLTNLLILPAVQLLLPGALLAGTMGIFLPGPAWALGQLFGLLGRYIIWVASAVGRLRFAAVDLSSAPWLLFTVGAWAVLAVWLLPRRERPRPLVPLLCLAALFAGALGCARLPVMCSTLTVAALDVGQGSATAFLSGGRACLVDCGGSGSDSAGDTAADWFASLGIVRLDALVLTHLDADHVNGAERLFQRMRVGTLILPDTGDEPERQAALLALAEAEGAQVLLVSETVERPLGDALITVYPPFGGGASNEEGLFVLCSAGGFDALITGDADRLTEKMLVKYRPLPDIELLMAGHHGAAGSTSAELLDAARPELAAVSVGRGNSYGHPSPETLSRLAERDIKVFRTDERGTVTFYVTGDGKVPGGFTVRAEAR